MQLRGQTNSMELIIKSNEAAGQMQSGMHQTDALTAIAKEALAIF